MTTITLMFIAVIIVIAVIQHYISQVCLTTKLDKYGAIQVFNKSGLVAILYRDRTIDPIKPISYWESVAIKEMSDRFEKEFNKLKK